MMNRPSFLCFAAGLVAGIVICLTGRRISSTANPAIGGWTWAGKAKVSAIPLHSEADPRQSRDAIRKRLQRVVREGDPLQRTRGMLAYLRGLNSGDFSVSAAILCELHLPLTAGEFELLLSAWSKVDREEALLFAARDREALRAILNEWSAGDPEAAHEWVLAHRPENDPDPLLGIVIPALARTDESRAIKLIAGLPREERWYVFRQMAPEVSRQGPQAVEDWLQKLPVDFRGEAVAQIIHELPPDRAEEAIDWLLRYPDGLMTANLAGLFRALVAEDEERARAVLLCAPEGPIRQEAMRGMVIEWSRQGRGDDALEVMKEAPADVDDAMIEIWVSQAIRQQPGQALEQVLQIPDPALREETGRKILARWPAGDAGGAPTWREQMLSPLGAAMPGKGH